MNAIYLHNAAELWTESGPTGRFVEVLEGEVQDYGGNVIYRGSAGVCAGKAKRSRLHCKLVPTSWRHVDGVVGSAATLWQFVIEKGGQQ